MDVVRPRGCVSAVRTRRGNARANVWRISRPLYPGFLTRGLRPRTEGWSLCPRGPGLVEACGELGVAFIAYSPICLGLLSGAASGLASLPPSLPLCKHSVDLGVARLRAASSAAASALHRSCLKAGLPGRRQVFGEQLAQGAARRTFRQLAA